MSMSAQVDFVCEAWSLSLGWSLFFASCALHEPLPNPRWSVRLSAFGARGWQLVMGLLRR